MIYFLQAPDGHIYDLEAPEGASEEQLTATLYHLKPEAATPFKQESGVLAGVKKGIEQLVSSGQTAIGAATGDANEAAKAALARNKAMERKYADQVSLEKVTDAYNKNGFFSAAGEAASQIPLAIAEQLPNFGASFAGAKAGAMAGSKAGSMFGARGKALGAIGGGLAGTFTPAYIQSMGGDIERQAQEQEKAGKPINIDTTAAATTAVPQAALDVVSDRILLGGKMFGKMIGVPEKLLMQGGSESVEKLAKERLLATITKGTATGIAGEVPTEVAQQALERYQAGLSVADADAFKEYGETAYQVALLGPLGIAGRLSEKGAARTEVQQKAMEKQRADAQAAEAAAAAAAPKQPDITDPAYLKQIQTQYQEAEQRKAALKGQLRKVQDGSVTETADRLHNKEIEEQIKAMTPELEQLAAEYNKAAKVAPAFAEPAAPAEMPEITAPAAIQPTLTVGDSLDNPLGRFTKDELSSRSPKLVDYIDKHRQKLGKPALNDYSIEDIRDAMPGQLPEAEKADLNSLIAAKTGYTPEVVYTPKDILNAAKQKNIATDTDGFKFFLQRATGDNDLTQMEQPQLHSAFKALSELPEFDETQYLPEKSSATHYSPEQYGKAVQQVSGLTAEGNVPSAQALQVAKQATGLKRDSDAQLLLQNAYTAGDLNLNSQGEFVKVQPAEQAEFQVEEGFAPAEPTGFNVMRGEQLLYSTQNQDEAKAKVESLGKTAEPAIKQIDKSIAGEKSKIAASQRSLDIMEAGGMFRTPQYQQASAAHAALVQQTEDNIQRLLEKKVYLQQPVTIQTTGRKANVKVYRSKELGVSEKAFNTREEALKHILENLPAARLNELAGKTKSPGFAKRLQGEVERRKNPPKPFVAEKKVAPEVKKETKTEKPDTTAEKEAVKSQLLPMLKKFGLGDVALKIEEGMEAEGSYAASLIKVALDANNPVRVLRHESVHGLKDLGFFTPGQWKVLENQADKVWIDKYLKQRNINGQPIKAGQQSRYEAYQNLYNGDMEAIREEAIADAFGDFDVNGAPKGVFATLLKQMQQFFEAMRNAFNGAGFETSDDVFGKVERGELKATNGVTGSQEKFALRPNPEVQKEVVDKVNLTPEAAAATSVGMQTGKAKQKQFSHPEVGGVPEIVQFLQDRRAASGLPLLDINKSEDRTTLAKLMTAEAIAAIRSGGNALAWYNQTIARMMGMAALKFPELKTDSNAQMAFKVSTAITSQGLNVEDNLAFSMKQYEGYAYNKRVNGIGQFAEAGQGADQAAMISNFKLANQMIKEYGEETTRKFLETEFSAEELRKAGFKITGELGDEQITGSSIFGPKIGFGFYSNLNGNFEPVTMDMWFMRLVGRLTGSLRKFDPDLFKTQLSRFRSALKEEGMNGVYANDFSAEALEKAKTDENAAIELARVINSVFNIDFKNNRELYNEEALKKTELVYSAQQIIGAVDSPRDAPSNGTERRQLRDVVNQTVDMVAKIQGQRIPPAALQALIWFPEQELYSTLGAKLRVTSQDYAGSIKKILSKEGYSDKSISAAAQFGARQLQRMANQPVGQATGKLGQKPSSAFTAEERTDFLEQARTKTVIAQERQEPKRKKIIFEVAPDPNNKALDASWMALDPETRSKISEGIARKVVRKVLAEFDVEGSFTSQVGSYEDNTNPSFALFLESGDSVEIAKFLGFALSQKSMMVVSPKEAKGTEKVEAITIDVNTQDPETIDQIYQKLRSINVNGQQPIGGQSTMNGKMILLNYSDVATKDLAHLVDHQLNGDYNVSVGDVYAAFPKKEGYNYASPSNDPRGKAGDLRQRSRVLRNESTQKLLDELFKIRQQKELATGRRQSIATSPAAKAAENLRNVVTDKTLFEAQTELNQYDEDILNEKVTPAQRAKAEKALAPYLNIAAQEKPAFDEEVTRIANDVGVQVRLDPVKNIVRASEKLVLETEDGTKKPNASLILDLLRATIVVDNEAAIPNAIREIEKSFNVTRVKDRFKEPAGTGYRDVLINVKLPSGLIAEIQVNIPAMVGSKSTGHKLYRMSRNMEKGTPDRMYLEELSRRLYDEAYLFSQNAISAASARDALLRKTSSGNDLSGSAAKTNEPSLSFRTGVASTAQTVAPSGTSNIQASGQKNSIAKLSLRAAPDTPEFKQFFGKSKIVNPDGSPKVMYHGLAKDTTDFTRKTERGAPIFLTDDPDFASRFAKDSFDYIARNPSKYLTKEQLRDGIKRAIKAIKKDYGNSDHAQSMLKSIASGDLEKTTPDAKEYLRSEFKDMLPTGPHIMPLYVRAEQPFDYSNPSHIKRVLAELTDGEELRKDLQRGSWETIESEAVQDAIKFAGFDSFYVKEHGVKNLAVFDPAQVKSATGNIGTYDINNPDVRYSLREFRKDDLPQNKQTYTIPANTMLFHGAHKTHAEQIEAAGRVLRSRPEVKASGGNTNEGGLIFFGERATAEQYSENRGDPMSVRFDQEAGVTRDAGTAFQTITDRPYRLIKKRYELSAKEAAKVTEALGLPDYKRLDKGDTASLAANRADDFNNSKAPRYQVTKAGSKQTMSAPWPIIFDALGVDGYFDDFGVAISAENGIRLEGKEGKMERYSLRTNVTEEINNLPNGAAINAAIDRVTAPRQEVGYVERMTDALNGRSETFSYLRQKALDRYNRLNDYEKLIAQQMGGVARLADQNAHAAALQSDAAAGVAASALGVGNRIGGIPVFRNGYTTVSNENGTVKGAVEIFAPLAKHGDPKIYQAYQFWAGAKRGSRLLASGKEALYTPQDMALAKQLEQQYPEFVSVQKDWIKYNDGLVKYAVDTGVISAKNAAEFTRYSDYVPFYRQIEGERTVGPNIFQSISGVKAPKKLTGSEAPLADFLETITRNTQSIIQAGMKNVAAQKAVDGGMMLQMVRKMDHLSSGPNVVNVLQNGEKVSYECADKLWVDAVSSLNLPEMPFLNFLAAPANFLRAAVTKDPGFMLANLLRDSISAYVTSGAKLTPVASAVKEMGNVLMNNSPEYQKLLSAGVLGGYEFSRNVEASTEAFEKDLRKKTGTKTGFEKAVSPFTFFWDTLEKGTEASDAATRIAVYKATLAETGNEAEAIHRALEVMNFNRKGSSAVVRIAAATIPFLNARMQGLDVFFRAGIRPFMDANATEQEKQVQRAMIIRGLTLMGLSVMYAAAVSGDPDYENQEEETKDNNWIIPMGEGRLPLKIPIPFEVGTLFKTIPERIYRSFFMPDQENRDTTEDLHKSMMRAIKSTFAINPVPQIAAPLLEARDNFSVFTQRNIVGQNMQGIAPEFQVGPSTSRWATILGQQAGMSPMMIDHVYKGYTGTMGIYAADILDAAINAYAPSDVEKPSKRIEQMPIIKRFMADPEARGKITSYFDLKHSVDTTIRTINLLEKNADPSLPEYVEKNAQLFAARDFMNNLNKQMDDLQKQANLIRAAPIPADEKRDMLAEITKAQNLLVNDIRQIRNIIKP